MSSKAAGIVVGLLGVALVALAVYSIATNGDLDSKVADLEDTTASLESKSETGGENAADEIEALGLGLKKVRACLPELQNEINGLGVEIDGSYSEGFYGYIENNSQISSYCNPVVYPDLGQGDE